MSVLAMAVLKADPGDDDPTPPAPEPDCGGGCGRQ